MKKLSKILFALIIMSTVVFTSCVDYTVPYNKLPLPPGYSGVVAQTHTQFERNVAGKNFYCRLQTNTTNNTKYQIIWNFDTVNRTFTKYIYTWQLNPAGQYVITNQSKDPTTNSVTPVPTIEHANYVYGNEIGKIFYRHGNSGPYNNGLFYVSEGADIMTINSLQFISDAALAGQSVINYTNYVVLP